MIELHAISAALTWALGDNHGGLSAVYAQFARAASPVALDAMWQGAAVAIVLFISLRLAPRVSAVHRFTAWIAGFAAVAALPFLPLAVHFFAGPGSAAAVAGVAASPRPWFEFDDRWALVIAALWLIASAFRFSQLVFHGSRLRRLWKTATPVAAEILPQLPVAGKATVCTTKELDRPSVIGFLAPRILIPEWLYARLTPQELKQVVLHEVEHLRRHDDWTNLIQKFVLVLFPLNPALAWIERRLCREREMACDEGVVQETQAPRAYAACLASLAGHGLDREMARRAEALSLAAWRRRPELVHRVHGILSRKPALNLVASRVLLSVVGCGLVAGSVELARCPQEIGFAAAPTSQELAQTAPMTGTANLDRVAYAPSGAAALAKSEAGFHMVQAKAILPASRNEAMNPATLTRRAATRPAAAPAAEIASRDANIGVPRETLLRAEMPAVTADPSAATNSDVPQYLVLTAYERVQYVPQNAREIADYDTNSVPGAQPATADKATAAPAPQITITRLIFRIAPAAAQSDAATSATKTSPSAAQSSTSKPVTSSHAVQQPAIIPFGNGWLVFQL